MGNNQEVRLEGIGAVSGIVAGKAAILDRSSLFKTPQNEKIKSVDEELKKLNEAVNFVDGEISRLSRFADMHSSDSNAEILEIQREILRDPELQKKIEELITSKHFSADRATYEAFDIYIDLFKSSSNTLLRSKLIDIRDIRNRIIRAITQKQTSQNFTEETVVIADEFSPAEIIMLTRQNVKGFVSDYGGMTSHASIVAGSMGLPMVIDTKKVSREARNGDFIIIDADKGEVVIRPDKESNLYYEKALSDQDEARTQLQVVIDEPNATKCGHPFTLRANVEFEEEISKIEEVRADGIGLLRTESFFISETDEEIDVGAQIRFYRKALEGSSDNQVTIRLLDIGGDKMLEPDIKEANPFLGWRGIRVLLDRRDLLRAQLEAILRVSAEFPGRVRVLIPMISTLEELNQVRDEIDRMYNLLMHRNCNADKSVQLGVMVEVPSIAIQADLFARHSDFLSIGTNDLTQFLLAADRGNARISKLFRQLHPSVWRMIANTVNAAKKYNKPVGVCGEMAANPMVASMFIGMGVDEISVAIPNLVKVKKVLRSMSFEDTKIWADRMDLVETVGEVDELINNWNKTQSVSGKNGAKS